MNSILFHLLNNPIFFVNKLIHSFQIYVQIIDNEQFPNKNGMVKLSQLCNVVPSHKLIRYSDIEDTRQRSISDFVLFCLSYKCASKCTTVWGHHCRFYSFQNFPQIVCWEKIRTVDRPVQYPCQTCLWDLCRMWICLFLVKIAQMFLERMSS